MASLNLLALITDGFGAPGGIARYNQDLMTALAESAAIATVLALPRFGAATGPLPPGITQLPAVPGRIAWMGQAGTLALRHSFDAVFCGHLNAAPLAAMLARLTGKPLWLQVHGIEAWTPRGWAIRRAVAEARLVTSVSRYTRARLIAWSNADPERARVLPNTVTDGFTNGPRPAHLLARHNLAGAKVILTVGRLAAAERYKGHDRIIAAFPAVLQRVPEAIYVVVGTGDDQPRLEACARDAGVSSRVLFAGGVAETELADYFRLADVFAMPSTGEGFGIVFLEAARCGLPVIGGSRDGSADALADGAIGTMIDPADNEALGAALVAALERGRPDAAATTVERFAFPNFAQHVDALVRQHLA